MPDPSPSLTVLNSNFLQLGRRSGDRPQRKVYPRRLPVNCDTHYVGRQQTHNLPIVSDVLPVSYRDHQDFSADLTVAADQFRTKTNLEQFGPKPIFIELFITSWMFKELLV